VKRVQNEKPACHLSSQAGTGGAYGSADIRLDLCPTRLCSIGIKEFIHDPKRRS
jgi:hypothetical protein